MLQLHNTLTRRADGVRPLNGKTVKLYTCGLTVYGQPHIGNWIGYIYWDVLVRAMRAAGYTVERTQNITDVGHLTSDEDSGEDKMEKGARREGMTAWDVAAKYSAIADEEAQLLDLLAPDHMVRATDMIDRQIAFAAELDKKGYLYEIPGDGMYFDTSRLDNYGELARLDIGGLEAGVRVPVDGKRNITDFAVWKFSHAGQKRDMEWSSPWGDGFPGWHLECSVIARETLGDQIDIHTGGIDHIPVHHTNEIAQTEAVINDPGTPLEDRKRFSQIWVHNNHLKADGQKMSKSLGNIYTLQDILDKGYDVSAFKLFALGKHYRTEGNFTWENLEAAQNRLDNWRTFAALVFQDDPEARYLGDGGFFYDQQLKILEVLKDDLNTPMALKIIDETFDMIGEGSLHPQDAAALHEFLEFLHRILGLALKERADITDEQKNLIAERIVSRSKKDWAGSDRLRDELAAQGVSLRDTPRGTVWYRMRNQR